MISAIVLAAGQSKRFGACKQLAVVDGKPLLQHALDALRQSKVDDVVVILGAYANEIREGIEFGAERIVLNPDYAEGMSTSIRAGIRAIGSDATFIVLADQPFVRATTYDRLIDEYRRTGATLLVPTFNGVRGNPALIDRSLFSEAMELKGDVGFRALFAKHEPVKVPVEDRGVLIDIDKPDEVARGPAPVSRVKSPAGLDIGAQGAEEIARSIVAEIVQRPGSIRVAPPTAAARDADVVAPPVDPGNGCKRTFERTHVA